MLRCIRDVLKARLRLTRLQFVEKWTRLQNTAISTHRSHLHFHIKMDGKVVWIQQRLLKGIFRLDVNFSTRVRQQAPSINTIRVRRESGVEKVLACRHTLLEHGLSHQFVMILESIR